jgi:hypothetical protein
MATGSKSSPPPEAGFNTSYHDYTDQKENHLHFRLQLSACLPFKIISSPPPVSYVQVWSSEAIGTVKLMIQDLADIPPHLQDLHCDGEPLEDGFTLADYNVRDDARLNILSTDDDIIVNPDFTVDADEKVRVSIVHWGKDGEANRKEFTLRTDPRAAVNDVKAAICDKLEIDPGKSCLELQGRLLEDNSSGGEPHNMSEFLTLNAKERSTIHVQEVINLKVCYWYDGNYDRCQFQMQVLPSNTIAAFKNQIIAKVRKELGDGFKCSIDDLNVRDGNYTLSHRDNRDVAHYLRKNHMNGNSIIFC